MQDRYAGDLGDFLKFGLLRWLAPDPTGFPRVGVVWYRTVDEGHNEDGKHVRYLTSGHPAASLRRLDPDLYERLARVVATGRSIDALVRADVLPGASFHNEVLDLGGLSVTARDARQQRRQEWLLAALVATDGCDVIFVDPDNGIRLATHPVERHRSKAAKHAYLDEVAAFTARGQSVVAYHHADRSAPVAEQARRRLDDIASIAEPVAAVRASRGTTRLYLVAAAQREHHDYLTRRLEELESSPWAAELTVHWHERSVTR